MSFGSGCRCSYDPNIDGGDYELLAAAKREKSERNDAGDGVHDSNATEMKDEGATNRESDDSDSDDEFDYLLDEEIETAPENGLQAQRRAELENMARQYEVLRYHGYGVHRQMHPQRVVRSVGYGSVEKDGYVPPGAVIHLYDPFSSLSVSLDLCLEDMAGKYPGTKFVRGIGVSSIVFAKDCNDNSKWREGNFPMLLALKHGQVVAFSSLLRDFSSSGQNEVEPRMVEQWLEYAGVLIDSPPPIEAVCRIRPEEDMLMENMQRLNGLGRSSELDDIDKQERYDCGVDGCIKTFFHEHVGVKNEAQDGVLVSESQIVSSTEPNDS